MAEQRQVQLAPEAEPGHAMQEGLIVLATRLKSPVKNLIHAPPAHPSVSRRLAPTHLDRRTEVDRRVATTPS